MVDIAYLTIFGPLDNAADDDSLMATHEPMSWPSSDCDCGGDVCGNFWGDVEWLQEIIRNIPYYTPERKMAQKALDGALVATTECEQVIPCHEGEIEIFKAFCRDCVRALLSGKETL